MKTLLIIQKQLTKLGNQDPYFSITAEEWETTSFGSKKGRDCISCGCLHEEIERRHKGKYTDLIALHLSKEDGTPMHAVENGFYYYQSGDMEQVKKHLRINEKQFNNLQGKINTAADKKQAFAKFVESLKPQWLKEANEAIKKHDLKIGK